MHAFLWYSPWHQQRQSTMLNHCTNMAHNENTFKFLLLFLPCVSLSLSLSIYHFSHKNAHPHLYTCREWHILSGKKDTNKIPTNTDKFRHYLASFKCETFYLHIAVTNMSARHSFRCHRFELLMTYIIWAINAVYYSRWKALLVFVASVAAAFSSFFLNIMFGFPCEWPTKRKHQH